MERGTKHGNYWDLKLDFPTDEPTTALTAKKTKSWFRQFLSLYQAKDALR